MAFEVKTAVKNWLNDVATPVLFGCPYSVRFPIEFYKTAHMVVRGSLRLLQERLDAEKSKVSSAVSVEKAADIAVNALKERFKQWKGEPLLPKKSEPEAQVRALQRHLYHCATTNNILLKKREEGEENAHKEEVAQMITSLGDLLLVRLPQIAWCAKLNGLDLLFAYEFGKDTKYDPTTMQLLDDNRNAPPVFVTPLLVALPMPDMSDLTSSCELTHIPAGTRVDCPAGILFENADWAQVNPSMDIHCGLCVPRTAATSTVNAFVDDR